MVFFFSSRRRHTRYWRDWSSDVCSSDLHLDPAGEVGRPPPPEDHVHGQGRRDAVRGDLPDRRGVDRRGLQIGRASCRERVQISVDAVSLKKKERGANSAAAVSFTTKLDI